MQFLFKLACLLCLLLSQWGEEQSSLAIPEGSFYYRMRYSASYVKYMSVYLQNTKNWVGWNIGNDISERQTKGIDFREISSEIRSSVSV